MSGIVIIEEDDLLRALLKEWLHAAGYGVREGGLREPPAGDRPDLVIVDLYMPRQAGRGIVCAVKRLYPGAEVIAMSAQFRSGLAGSSRAAQALGVQYLLAKPFTRSALLGAVARALSPALRPSH